MREFTDRTRGPGGWEPTPDQVPMKALDRLADYLDQKARGRPMRAAELYDIVRRNGGRRLPRNNPVVTAKLIMAAESRRRQRRTQPAEPVVETRTKRKAPTMTPAERKADQARRRRLIEAEMDVGLI